MTTKTIIDVPSYTTTMTVTMPDGSKHVTEWVGTKSFTRDVFTSRVRAWNLEWSF